MIDHPDPQIVRNQLSRMLDSRYFRTSPRLRSFLLYTVEQGLAGCEERLKEYCIALAVFGKPDSFDPRVDSAVRVAARQLRAKIDIYYLNEGINDPVLIRYRPGDYLPRFYMRSDLPTGAYDRIEGRAVIVDKDRATIAAVSECFDTMGVPIGAVVDSGEDARARTGRVARRCVDHGRYSNGSDEWLRIDAPGTRITRRPCRYDCAAGDGIRFRSPTRLG